MTRRSGSQAPLHVLEIIISGCMHYDVTYDILCKCHTKVDKDLAGCTGSAL